MRAALTVLVAAVCALSCACGCGSAQGPQGGLASNAAGSSHVLSALFAAEWDYQQTQWPDAASRNGDRRFDDRWPDMSPAGFAARDAHARELQRKVRALDRTHMSDEDRLNLELFARGNDDDVEGQPFGLWHLVLDQRSGIQTADELGDLLPFQTVPQYEAWITRLGAIGPYVDGNIASLREGIALHVVQPRVAMERVPGQIAKQVVSDPAKSLFYAPLRRMPASFSQADRDRLDIAARAAIMGSVVPAYQRLAGFFTREYLPACFTAVGAWQLPRGDEAYAYLARSYTTTRLTPQEIHDVGLREVSRIRSEMLSLMQSTGFKGSLSDFFAWLRADPQFFYADAASLLRAYRATAKRIDPKLVLVFRTLPRTPYGVEPIPDAVAPDTTAAYYQDPAEDGSRAGTFFVNLYEPEVRPRWEMTALTLHESVPGHHLQIAMASEQTGLPEFRRHASWTAFVEGWGLYAESLGEDMGVYEDAYARFGQLSFEMWRAVRLVVDTGIHALHWERKRAIDYFLENAPRSELDVTNEVDRYIAWPGQALAYKIGQLEILRLREHARAKLGPRFDIKAFHDVVLEAGAMPLDVLGERIDAWIAHVEAQGLGTKR
jgi:uncharacterized protein (DUF885 family)